MTYELHCDDAQRYMKTGRMVDLVFGSSPYEDARLYNGNGTVLTGQDWVDWMVSIYRDASHICTGIVAFVVEGRTKNYRWSATPSLLEADLHRAGFNVRHPYAYYRFGVPGSAGLITTRIHTNGSS